MNVLCCVCLPVSCRCTAATGKMSRDAVVSQTAAAMLAWFEQQLSQSVSQAASRGKGSSGPPAATAVHAASAAHVPLASVGLNAAAMTAAVAPAPAVEGSEAQQDGVPDADAFGERVQQAFKSWVMSPMTQEEVEFSVKGSPGVTST